MLGGLFNNLYRGEGAYSNFEIFRKALNSIYTMLNRLTSGKTFVDLFTAQNISTPILVNDTVDIDKDTALLALTQIPNFPSKVTIQSIDTANDLVILPSTHKYYLGCPIIYRNIGGTIASLTDKEVYFIRTISGSSISLSSQLGGSNIDISGVYTGTATVELADPLPQLNETNLLRLDSSIPGPSIGNLAYGDYLNGTSSLYYYGPNGYDYVKLGWPGGAGIYNNNAIFSQTYTGWPHGMGNVKIVSYSGDAIDISFDFIEVVEPGAGIRDIVPGLRTSPATSYNVRIINGTPGLNSVDQSLVAATNGYWVYLVFNPTTQQYGGYISKSNTSPVISDGFEYIQRLGWIVTDANGNFIPSLQINRQFLFAQRPGAVSTITTSSTVAQTSAIVDQTLQDSLYYPTPSLLADITVAARLTATGSSGTAAIRKEFWLSTAIQGSSTAAFQKGESWVDLSSVGTNTSDYVFNNIPISNTARDTSNLIFNVKNGGTVSASFDATIMGFRFNQDLYY